jgi:hypothetical protein
MQLTMNETQVADKLELTELANKLFMLTDVQEWDKLVEEVFAEELLFDMSSASGEAPQTLTSKAICDMWRQGFAGLDAVHHQAGHYLITVDKNAAEIYAYAVATHYKRSAARGKTRTFVGSYDLKAIRSVTGWRLSQFKYNLKYIDGNLSLD